MHSVLFGNSLYSRCSSGQVAKAEPFFPTSIVGWDNSTTLTNDNSRWTTTLPLRRSNLLSRYPSHSSSSSLSLKSPSHSSSSSSLCCFATTPPLRLSVATTPLLRRRHISFNASESHGCLPPRNPNPTTNRHPTGRDLTPPADAISNLVLFVDRLVPQSGGSE
ncbi:uncharacterized protein HKW66_Vig0007260 [Vigna angularis]|uniref:Uncharacterized protein n=1 Tax=Phaseolus angularis TaxID=3914 RepID=A0A8T0LF22_PHAAN|nr:uncharacterized protein HKW66_Vig0007260 [Vigna angularis]